MDHRRGDVVVPRRSKRLRSTGKPRPSSEANVANHTAPKTKLDLTKHAYFSEAEFERLKLARVSQMVAVLDKKRKAQTNQALEVYQKQQLRFADAALSEYNRSQAEKSQGKAAPYELVKVGTGNPFLTFPRKSESHPKHINFEAKMKGVPDADVETFFAQVVIDGSSLHAEFVKCLGPSCKLSAEGDFRDCRYCTYPLHHPPTWVNGEW